MSGISGSQRFTAVRAAVLLLMAAPLGAPAHADPNIIEVSALVDSTELLQAINGGDEPDDVVTYEVTTPEGPMSP